MANMTRKKAADAVQTLRKGGVTDPAEITRYLMAQGASPDIIRETLEATGMLAEKPPAEKRPKPVPVRAIRQEFHGHAGVSFTLGEPTDGKRGASKFLTFRWLRRLAYVIPSDVWGDVFSLEGEPLGAERNLGTLPIKSN